MPKIKRNDPAPLVQTGKPVLYDQDLDPAPVRAARTPKPVWGTRWRSPFLRWCLWPAPARC